MKRVLFIVSFLIVSSAIAWSQTAADSSRQQERRRVHRMIDENGDGINDRLIGTQRRARQGNDKFIDADGDGICDGREGGLGFRRGKTPTEGNMQPGRKGQRGK